MEGAAFSPRETNEREGVGAVCLGTGNRRTTDGRGFSDAKIVADAFSVRNGDYGWGEDGLRLYDELD
jgi:hypothetical protein